MFARSEIIHRRENKQPHNKNRTTVVGLGGVICISIQKTSKLIRGWKEIHVSAGEKEQKPNVLLKGKKSDRRNLKIKMTCVIWKWASRVLIGSLCRARQTVWNVGFKREEKNRDLFLEILDYRAQEWHFTAAVVEKLSSI